MYTIVENARIVIALLKAHNIRHIVLSPGGSNIPIVQGVQNDPFFNCYSVVDERSAMYVAIGIYLKTGELVATSCTSAQATRNYVPGLTEAFYKHVPILAITMSKHPRFVGQEYMQCPVQTSLPVDAVKKSYTLPRISTEDDRQLCVRVTNEAILELTHHTLGPVQLNIEALDSETWLMDEKQRLPSIRTIKRHYLWDDLTSFELDGKRIMVLIGEHTPFSPCEIKSIEKFCENNNAFVYATHISNFSGKYTINGLPVLIGASYDSYKSHLEPQIVITLGGVTGDYDCFHRLSMSDNSELQVWRVSLDGNVVDTYGHLTNIFQMRIVDFFDYFCKRCNNKGHEYYSNWLEYKGKICLDNLELPLSNLYVAQKLHSIIPPYSHLNFAILNSFRSWLYFDIDKTIKSFCNVAAFGIDGCLSTMLGQSFVTDDLCFLIIGDLAFYYDMNSLAIRHIKNNVRIVLINNNGGGEFKLSGLQEKISVSSYISADGHFKNSKEWALINGFSYFSVNCKDDFDTIVKSFAKPSETPIIIEVFVNPEDDRDALRTVQMTCSSKINADNVLGSMKKGILNMINKMKK